jgi:hypothetical protein
LLARRAEIVVADDRRVVAVGRADLQPLGPDDLASAVADGFGALADTVHVPPIATNDFRVVVDLVSTQAAGEVRPGDVLQAGVRITHDFLGTSPTHVEGFVLRLVCANGLVRRECPGARKGRRTRRLNALAPGAAAAQRDQLRRRVAEEFATARQAVGQARDLARTGEQVDVPALLTDILRVARLGSGGLTRTVVERGWRIEQAAEPTHFAALNALTWVATHHAALDRNEWVRPTPLQAAVLARLAGVYLGHRGRRCPRCQQLLNQAG